jgi:hypothetical protein
LFGTFVQDQFSPRRDLTVTLGLRYDLDTAGNNPRFTHPLVPRPRGRDTNNFQPRGALVWDLRGDARHIVRGGAGMFIGRFLLNTAQVELIANGVTGRRQLVRANGALLGLPQLALDPTNPLGSGLPVPENINIADPTLVAPEAVQASAGYSARLGSTGLYIDLEALLIKGRREIVSRDVNFNGNGNPTRPNPNYSNVIAYGNQGRSMYKAFVVAVKGRIGGKHLLTTSLTVADKRNIADDFSPEFSFGYPSDSTDLAAEYGLARSHERVRFVASAIMLLPWQLTIAPIFEYGSGQSWTRRLGYDFNGDGLNSDRAAGVPRNSMAGPRFTQLSVRGTRRIALNRRAAVDVIAEVFNLFNVTNYDVQSIGGNSAERLAGPTLLNPGIPAVPNPHFGQFTAAFAPREIQLGVRVAF